MLPRILVGALGTSLLLGACASLLSDPDEIAPGRAKRPSDAGTEGAACDPATAGFCDHFDDEPALTRWEERGGGGTIVLDPDSSTSPPRSILFIPSRVEGSPAMLLRHAIEAPRGSTGIRCTFDVQLPTTGPGEVAGFFFGLEGATTLYEAYGIALGYQRAQTVLWEYGLLDGGEIASPQRCDASISDGKWHHLDVLTDFGPVEPRLTVAVDGIPCSTRLLQRMLPERLTLKIGANFGGREIVAIRFDTLACTVR